MAKDAEGIEDAQHDDEHGEHKHVDSHNDEVDVALVAVDPNLVVVRDQEEDGNEKVEDTLADPGGIEPEKPAEELGHEDFDCHDVKAEYPKNEM